MSRNSITVVGIDEAGYGPRLGPLVVGLAAFRVPRDRGGLRALLPATSRRGGSLPVDDSKRIYRGGVGLPRLERSVLAFRSLAGRGEIPDAPREAPAWAPRHPPALPLAASEEEVAESRTILAADLERSGVSMLELRTRTVMVEEFNREAERSGSKAHVLFQAAMELVAPWLRAEGETEIYVDRHGGRAYYSKLIAERFPDLFHWVEVETSERSVYRFGGSGGEKTMAFEVGGDGRHLATALASMSAKYVREIHMRALNDHFSGADPALTPTAGYWQDAERWLRESEPVRLRLGVPEEALVRRR